jgi:hypothetical protein
MKGDSEEERTRAKPRLSGGFHHNPLTVLLEDGAQGGDLVDLHFRKLLIHGKDGRVALALRDGHGHNFLCQLALRGGGAATVRLAETKEKGAALLNEEREGMLRETTEAPE